MNPNQLRRLMGRKALGVVSALTIAGLAMASPIAHAATAGSPAARSQTVTIPAGVTTFSASAGSGHFTIVRTRSEAQESLSCTLTPDLPFYEGTTNGEEGIASIQCTQAVSELYVQVALQENGVIVSQNSSEDYSSSYVAAYTVYGYSPGTYETLSAGVACTSSCSAPGYADSSSVYLA